MNTSTNVAQGPRKKVGGSTPTAQQMSPAGDLTEYLKCYARERPEVAALWCFGLGFVIGWKLKPW